ncbi:GNAT family N-acetyltransferase [Algoriphagus resistens]|uniref:GNAT family N-acetyltransferase n=1 Tax=Algoriphagus resistens TaxID=1750590 RepID=UPI000716C092|nr:GNAT family N-acetyltransferase [Algoriphagus resistens]
MQEKFKNDKILLKRLAVNDADQYYKLYTAQNGRYHDYSSIKPIEFTEQIIAKCNCIFTIRSVQDSTKIIGDCALHHWNKEKNEMEIGGLLLPHYWGRGFMASAFQILADLAKKEFGIQTLIARTESTNSKALRFAMKNGFAKKDQEGILLLLVKDL